MSFFRNLRSWLDGSVNKRASAEERPAKPVAVDYVPHVTKEDVLRIIRRDYSTERPDAVLAILDQYGTEAWQGERDRVHLAVLKLSNGVVDNIRHHVLIACTDYRDVISPAEYPEFFRIGFVGVDRMDTKELECLTERDKQQYHQWLTRS